MRSLCLSGAKSSRTLTTMDNMDTSPDNTPRGGATNTGQGFVPQIIPIQVPGTAASGAFVMNPATPAAFSAPIAYSETFQATPSNPQITAGYLLDYPIPAVQSFPEKAKSSTFTTDPSIKIIDAWKPAAIPPTLPPFTTGPKYYPVNEDRTIAPIATEGDVVWAAKHYIISPVNIALQHQLNAYQISCRSEYSTAGGTSILDMCWTYIAPNTKQPVDFAVIEFKAPGAIDVSDWKSTFVSAGKGKNICQQLLSYAGKNNIRYVVAFDWEKMILLKLGAPSTENGYIDATGSWVEDKQRMKHTLFEFVREAFLAKHGV